MEGYVLVADASSQDGNFPAFTGWFLVEAFDVGNGAIGALVSSREVHVLSHLSQETARLLDSGKVK